MKKRCDAWDIIGDYRQRYRNALLRIRGLREKKRKRGNEIQNDAGTDRDTITTIRKALPDGTDERRFFEKLLAERNGRCEVNRYEKHLTKAGEAQCRGDMKETLRQLRIAEKHGYDEHLPLWIKRVEITIEESKRKGVA